MSTNTKQGQKPHGKTVETPFGTFEKGEEVRIRLTSNWIHADNPEVLYGTVEGIGDQLNILTIQQDATEQRIHPDGTIYNRWKSGAGQPGEMGEVVDITPAGEVTA